MSIEVLKQVMGALVKSKNALEVLWVSHHANRTDYAIEDIDSAMEALRTAIQQAEAKQPAMGEPVAYRHLHEDGWEYYDAPTGDDCNGCQPLFTHPAVVPDDVQQIIKEVCEAYRGTDYGKVAESICDKLIEAITAAHAQENALRDGV